MTTSIKIKPCHRPYCSKCKALWGKQTIGKFNFKPIVCKTSYEGTIVAGYIAAERCPRCGGPVIMKSFNPWGKILGGLGILIISCVTLAIQILPIIWIGGFIWGVSMIVAGISVWSKAQSADENGGDRFP